MTQDTHTGAGAQPAPALQPEALRIAMHLRQRAQLSRPGNLDTLSAAGANELERQHTELSTVQAAASDTEFVLIDGIAYEVPAAVAAELLSLHLDLLAVPPAQAVAVPGEALPYEPTSDMLIRPRAHAVLPIFEVTYQKPIEGCTGWTSQQ